MIVDELICLGQLKSHSCYPWYWDRKKDMYCQECSISGCGFVVFFTSLIPVGQTSIVGGSAEHEHDWGHWVCMHDQHGIRDSNEWLYKRKCATCDAEQMAEDLAGVGSSHVA